MPTWRELNLGSASFHDAKLIGANLQNLKRIGDITHANFTSTIYAAPNLEQATDYGEGSTIFRLAKYDRRTRWPSRVNPEEVGAVFVKGGKPEAGAGPRPRPQNPSQPRHLFRSQARGSRGEVQGTRHQLRWRLVRHGGETVSGVRHGWRR